eukprot:TRINITY_DN10278_c0_g2_i1.p2 TRINITY_DN10278_c0_g2~~TRINITY_DN10278_c0_g2_i1.p2  ORF type:complete len:219 (-),score=5.26 TRINITY_DN10278_c0_g2_i1:683-1339(-)
MAYQKCWYFFNIFSLSTMVERLEDLCVRAIRSNALHTLQLVEYDISVLVDEYKTSIAAGITDTKTLQKVEHITLKQSNEDLLRWTWYLWYMALCRDFSTPTQKELKEVKPVTAFEGTLELPYVQNQLQQNRDRFKIGNWREIYQQRVQKRRAGQLAVKKDAVRLNKTINQDISQKQIQSTSIKRVGDGPGWYRNINTPVTARGRIMKKIGMKRTTSRW